MMPSLADLDMTVSPSDDPMAYPGKPVTEDRLLVDDWLYRLESRPNASVSDWLLEIDGGPWGDKFLGKVRLAEVMDAERLAPVPVRRPVLAVGSNASPAQLRRKFRGGDLLIPMTTTRVKGLGVAHSAHVSAAGYIPYAPFASPSTSLHSLVLWLDQDQIELLDKTEPNYIPTLIDGQLAQARLSSGSLLESFTVYRSRWGLLAKPGLRPVPARGQRAIYSEVCSIADIDVENLDSCDAEALGRHMSSNLALRERITESLRDRGYVSGDGLDSLAFSSAADGGR
jgi:hypothetical protein